MLSNAAYHCKTPVLLIFFNRPETFEKVFAQVRKAKPDTLILAQDGPRNDQDKHGIAACRKIAESVDWKCNIITDYSEINLGCGVRPQSAITNALTKFEQVIILEDDCIPSLSFFPYCEELLEKYKDDDRIAYISGLNHFETWDCGDADYFFTKTGAIWGWATWRRAWSKYYDYYIEDAKNKHNLNILREQFKYKFAFESRFKQYKKVHASKENGEKLSYWDIQWGYVKYSQNMLVPVPKKNLICNIGIGSASTHAKKMKTERYIKYRNFVFIPTYDLDFPLKHPTICIPDIKYDDLVYRCTHGTIVKKVLRKTKNFLSR